MWFTVIVTFVITETICYLLRGILIPLAIILALVGLSAWLLYLFGPSIREMFAAAEVQRQRGRAARAAHKTAQQTDKRIERAVRSHQRP